MRELNIEKTIEELRNLQTIQKKYEESQNQIEKQKLKIEILEAEKLTLQAEKNIFEAEKKTFEVRFEEVNLKLKLKTAEYESLLAKRVSDKQESTAQSSANQQSDPIIIEDESIEMAKSAPRKRPTPKPRKRKASGISIADSANKENSVDNSNKMTRFSSEMYDMKFIELRDEDIRKYIDLFIKEEVENGRDPADLSLKDTIKRINSCYAIIKTCECFLTEPIMIKRICYILRKAQREVKKQPIVIN